MDALERSQQSSPFLKVPDEILVAIFNKLSKLSCSRGPLIDIALVSKRFKNVIEQILYRDIWIDVFMPTERMEDDPPQPGDLKQFNGLVETLTQYTYLQSYVRTLRLEELNHFPDTLLFQDHNQLLNLIPGVRKLFLNPPLHLVFPTFTRLESVSLDCWEPALDWAFRALEGRINLVAMVRQLLWIPTLQQLRLDHIYLDQEGVSDPWPKDRCRTSSVTTLRIETNYSTDEIGMLPDVLLSIKALKRFTLTTPVRKSSDTTWDILSPQSIAQTLHPHVHTLVKLTITSDDETPSTKMSLMNMLPQYSSLRELGIPESFLAHPNDPTFHEYLPPQLEELQLQYAWNFKGSSDKTGPLQFKRMMRLAENKNKCCPALRLVIWWVNYKESDESDRTSEDEKRWKHFASVFERVGVQFHWLFEPEFPDTPFGHEEDREWFN
ncbi:hypothetical protein MMC12_005574 [Toensbergia leucococca]|nr:hypothetical protein [Toensbergia leucococca]